MNERTQRAERRAEGRDFIRDIIAEDLARGKHASIVTRFPPEPNGFLHIGHAKAICLNFGLAEEVAGSRCHLRFDDTNPETEEVAYVEAIERDVAWLGFDWGEHLYFASDYFEQMYAFSEHLITAGKAYVDSQSEDEIRLNRGTINEPGQPSPYRERSVEENLELFRRMRRGEFPNGAHVLRGKIDMASPNMLLRDPVLYRIRHAHHYRTGDDWCIYPLYDYAHPLEDAIECVTHSLCTLEFEGNRPLYDWVVENTPVPSRPRQYEFARLNLDYTIMSKRKLLLLVNQGHVSGWDDPRMPTLAGLRRRGVTPEAIRRFCHMIGVSKADSRVDVGKLEYAIREDLNTRAPRVLAVLRPLKVVITNYGGGGGRGGGGEDLEAPYWPHDVAREGSRTLPFGREIFIDRDDFMEDPPRGYFRLAPGREVRLRYAYIIRCDEVVKDDAGEIVELRCTYDPATRGGAAPEGRKVQGTIHWVSAEHSLPCTVRLYDRLFVVPDPDAAASDAGREFTDFLSPESLVTLEDARIEPSVQDASPSTHYQFERLGYFVSDDVDSSASRLVFNRTVTLRDTWGRRAGAGAGAAPEGARSRKSSASAPARAPGPAQPIIPSRAKDLEVRRARYEADGLSADHAELLTREAATADLFEAALKRGASARSVANWIINELPRELGDRALTTLPFAGLELGTLIKLVEDGEVSGSVGREVLAEMLATGDAAQEIVARKGLTQISDEAALGRVVEEVVTASPAKAAEYRAGRTGLLGYFMGQVMASTRGRANPELAKKLLESRLAREG
ncbi:MAG: glutamine--tRNA ligase/YqeY domain fusion protein [Longimicrobiales bacterium]